MIDNPLVFLKRTIRRILRQLGSFLPYRHIEVLSSHWDVAFRGGAWDRLKSVESEPSYHLLAALCHSHAPRDAAILDLGCGEGILVDFLARDRYGLYLGVDVSAEAVARARKKGDERHQFIVSDITKYAPARKFNLILLNECLYYFPEPVKLIQRYGEFLKDDGKLVVSMYEDSRTLKLWRLLDRRLTVVYEVDKYSRNRRPCGTIKVYKSRVSAARESPG
jgi:trans-aconitate methyltransferase